MTKEEIKARQKEERDKCLALILKSASPKKLIVAGPGTGKTFAFREVLKLKIGGCNIAMTFIRKLVADMTPDLSAYAEVKTFHAYCKKVLHEHSGSVELFPDLTKVIEKDAQLLKKDLSNFDTKLRELAETSPEVMFYFKRGDYYGVVSFDEAVFKLLKILRKNPHILPTFDQILIDEFQDFHPLEVAFINELEKKGPILIVGDDDQAIYDDRSASPNHLRQKYGSGDYEIFTLPFCGRCTEVIVLATNALIQMAQKLGHFKGRIAKPYECYIADKEKDSAKHPKIITAQFKTATVIPKYVQLEISRITAEDIADSYKEGGVYPTVLIIGSKQYLTETAKQLRKSYPEVAYSPSKNMPLSIVDAYELILKDENSNLGWRILMELFFKIEDQRMIIAASESEKPMRGLLDQDFVGTHLKAIQIVNVIRDSGSTPVHTAGLKSLIGDYGKEVIKHFAPAPAESVSKIDKTRPSILLTTFQGCKGLSAGHVFIVGANNGSIPKNPAHIRDVEISRFIVALTRTRKCCYILSNKWLVFPKNKDGSWAEKYEKSLFINWIPSSCLEDLGTLAASDLS